MFVELHLVQNFAPSNLNRDDTGAPKDCEFGGARRARISSQCLKRAVRTAFKNDRLVPDDLRAVRTKRLVDEELVPRLVAAGRVPEVARAVVTALLAGAELKVDDEGKTQYLLFLAAREIDQLTRLCIEHWDALVAIAPAAVVASDGESARSRSGAAGRQARQAKKAGRNALPKPVVAALEAALNGGKAADLALFGRMLADLPERNIDAACQVAHALSTNGVSIEFDFYTAVDDLRPEDTAGADMLGTVEFNSACFYRYANVDLGQLTKNLGGDAELARRTLRAFLQASITAIPTGKQNSMAAQNPPSFIFAVARERGLWSLANAFAKPIAPGRGQRREEHDLVGESVAALDGYWRQLAAVYGTDGIVETPVVVLDPAPLDALAPSRVGSVAELLDRIDAAVAPEAAA